MPISRVCSWLFLGLLSFLSEAVLAQTDRYIVYFKDKAGTAYSLSKPEQFLSAKSIARRQRNQVATTSADFPVNPSYRQALSSAGAKVLFTSRWFNCALVESTAQISSALSQLPMVQSLEYVAPGATASGRTSRVNKHQGSSAMSAAASQLSMLGIDRLQRDGYTGTGVTIAVMDSGFPGVSTLSAFEHLRSGNRIGDVYNFAYNRQNVYGFDTHGEHVLSILAAKSGNEFVGSAPDANYLLYVTEYVPTEYRVEEFNWLFAAERADSAGADVINTSLGYFTFDDPSMDYTYASMDGKTTLISRAAAKAAERGIIVVCSAGNEGGGSWKYISAPADAEPVLAVGAVDSQGLRATFSSVGPTADNRTKPDIMAQGAPTKYINTSGETAFGSGTSFSSPIAAGMVAGLIQALPDLTAAELISRMRSSGDRAQNPNNQYGFGIPDYSKFSDLITGISEQNQSGIFPNPGDGDRIRLVTSSNTGDHHFTILDISGTAVASGLASRFDDRTIEFVTGGLPSGMYLVRIRSGEQVTVHRYIVR